jgi:hypothetical protein
MFATKGHTIIKHVPDPPNIPLKLGQLYQNGLLEIFGGSSSKLEFLGKTPLKFYHAPTRSIELHSCPLGTLNIHYLYQN